MCIHMRLNPFGVSTWIVPVGWLFAYSFQSLHLFYEFRVDKANCCPHIADFFSIDRRHHDGAGYSAQRAAKKTYSNGFQH